MYQRIYDAFAHEILPVSSSAVGLTVPAGGAAAEKAIITVETASVRFWIDGTTDPIASEGHLVIAGQGIELAGANALKNFKAIRVSSDATLMITYER